MFHLQDFNVLKMEILKSMVKVLELLLLMRGMCGRKDLMEKLLLNGSNEMIVFEKDNQLSITDFI